MKIYFTEKTFLDNSRVGYDSVFITCSLVERKGSYGVEIDDRYTPTEAMKLGNSAIKLALDRGISVGEAVSTLKKRRWRK